MAKLKSIIKLKNAMNPNQKVGDIEIFDFNIGFEVIVPIFDENYEEYGFEKGIYLVEDSNQIYQIIDECIVYNDSFHPSEPDCEKFLNAEENDYLVIGATGIYRKIKTEEIQMMIETDRYYPYVPSTALVINGKVHKAFKYGQNY